MTSHGVPTASSRAGQRRDLRHGGTGKVLKEACAALALPLHVLADKGLQK